MNKDKYYYIIVNKENGNPYIDSNRLPIFWKKNVAIETINEFTAKTYCVRKLLRLDIEKLILKSKP